MKIKKRVIVLVVVMLVCLTSITSAYAAACSTCGGLLGASYCGGSIGMGIYSGPCGYSSTCYVLLQDGSTKAQCAAHHVNTLGTHDHAWNHYSCGRYYLIW